MANSVLHARAFTERAGLNRRHLRGARGSTGDLGGSGPGVVSACQRVPCFPSAPAANSLPASHPLPACSIRTKGPQPEHPRRRRAVFFFCLVLSPPSVPAGRHSRGPITFCRVGRAWLIMITWSTCPILCVVVAMSSGGDSESEAPRQPLPGQPQPKGVVPGSRSLRAWSALRNQTRSLMVAEDRRSLPA